MQIREIGLVAICLTVFVLSFVYFGIAGGSRADVYQKNDNKSIENVMRLTYDFTISLLFFGFSAIVVMFIEGLELGVLFASKKAGVMDFVMLLPVFLSVYSSILIGKAMLRDYRGTGTIHEVLKEAAVIFIAAIVIAIVLGSF